MQAYVEGELVDSATTSGEAAVLRFRNLKPSHHVHLLTVDAANVDTDYWSTYFSNYIDNHITYNVQATPDYLDTDTVKFYIGDPGGTADTEIAEKELFHNGHRAGCWGSAWGSAWGYEDYGSGWGYNWGYGWAYGIPVIEYRSGVLSPHSSGYPVKTTIVDAAGNESTADTATVGPTGYNTYPGEPSSLTVDSDFVISFTASEDL